MIGKIKDFIGDVTKEMKKVSWPTKEQLKESTGVVLVFTLIFTLFVFGIDQLMSLIMTSLF